MKPSIRTITLGIAEPHPLTAASVDSARSILDLARDLYQTDGYEVQTLRISTRPLFQDLEKWRRGALLSYVKDLQGLVDSAHVDFCSLGTAQPNVPLDQIEILPDLLIGQDLLSASVQIASREGGIRFEAAEIAARIIKRLSYETTQSFGNFRFAVLANVAAGGPFFPSAYHAGQTSLTVGTQGADVIAAVARQALSFGEITPRVRSAMIDQARPIVRIAADVARQARVLFGGIDLSPAPYGRASIAAAMESLGFGPVGSPGTLTAAAALTTAIQTTGLPTCGYNGLMLPVLEDDVLGRRWADGSIDVHKLLCYSAVCGTGLDMIPIPGSTPEAQIKHLLLDVATLAVRLDKPLSARLMPVAGAQDGEVTAFTSQYITNTIVRPLSVAPSR